MLPIRLGCDPYGFIGRYQVAQGAGKAVPELASSLFKIFIDHESTAEEMVSAVVDYFAASHLLQEALRRLLHDPDLHLDAVLKNAAVESLFTSSSRTPFGT
jgi:hypothetical protein